MFNLDFLKKEKTITLNKYFELVKPEYKYIKILPHKSIRNYNSVNIAKSIAYTYKSLEKRLRLEQKKLFFETNFKISYIIDIEKGNVSFYFLVPKPYLNVLLEKIKEVWGQATVEILDEIKAFSKAAEYYELSYKKIDALSLNVDRRSNEPLNSILNVMDIMKEEDRVTIVYNFLPTPQIGWLSRYEKAMERFREKKPLEKESMSASYITKVALGFVLGTIDMVLEVVGDFLGSTGKKEKESLYRSVMGILERQGELTPATRRKKEATVLPTQIAVISESSDDVRKKNNVMAACQAFRVLDEDNELKYKRSQKKLTSIENYNFGSKISEFSCEEIQNFIQIPGRSALEEFGIEHINVEQIKIPEKLRNGYISLGDNIYKGERTTAYLEDDREIGSLPLMILGRQGGGKTTYKENYAKFATSRREGIVDIDFIKNCEASKAIAEVIDPEDLIILDFSTEAGLQSLSYNEVKFKPGMSWFEKQALANKKTDLTIELINSINTNGEPLTPKMERYLSACTDIVYLNENATLKDVVKVLQDFEYRDKVINEIPEELRDDLDEEIRTLRELDEWSAPKKDTPAAKIGTRDAKIDGIMDRITLLKRDFYLKKMFNKKPDQNIDFVEAMEAGKVVLIRMPQAKFKDYVRNVITTFIVTKCWLAAELRGELSEYPKRSHILIDEISQTKTAERFMKEKVTRTRKLGIKFVITGQHLGQLDRETVKELKGAGASFMLLKGAIREDFEYFRDEIDESFEYEDLKKMEAFSSFNIIQYSDDFATFITKLPKPIKR